MLARLISLIAVSGVAVLLLLGGSVLAESPPEVPDARLMLGKVLLAGGEEPVAELKPGAASPSMLRSMPTAVGNGRVPAGFFGPHSLQPELISDGFPIPDGVGPPDCGPAACGPLGGNLAERLNFLPRMTDYVFNPPQRHRDIGQPLIRESWRYRPFGLSGFVGFINGGTLIDDWTGSDNGTLYGFRLSWDPGYYWGCEFRYAATTMGRWDSERALLALAADEGTYYPVQEVNMELWDCSLLWYPWGDSTWRPYALVGLGGAKISFDDCFANHWAQQHFAMPVALGLKYRYNSRLAFRFEVADNIVFSSGQVNSPHHFSITGGLEMRFGGSRKAYWPWNPGRNYW